MAIDPKQRIKCAWGKNDFNRMGFSSAFSSGSLNWNCTQLEVPEPENPANTKVALQGLTLGSYSSILLFNSIKTTGPEDPGDDDDIYAEQKRMIFIIVAIVVGLTIVLV